ncbi:MAG: alpha/beta hydrolase [Oscillospiraceae bacterium]|nr:alpha/beta hydrolase [Oscillospiraceae bacterium]
MALFSRRAPTAEENAEERRLQLVMKALKSIHAAVDLEAESLDRQRKGQELLGRLVAPMRGMDYEEFDLKGMKCAWVRPQRGYARRYAILYCHGGGYTSGNLGYSRILASKLAYVTGYPVLSFEYRLAPEHPYPAQLKDALKVWDHLMYLGYGARDVVVAGDSAGGNLALILTLMLKRQGRRLPRALALFSPWTDLTASDPCYQERAERDPMLTLEYIHSITRVYAGGRDLRLPLLSPLFGDLSGFPPVLIQVGGCEILNSDSVRLRDRLIEAQCPCRLEVWENLWHVFQMFPMREASEAMEHVGAFLLELF